MKKMLFVAALSMMLVTPYCASAEVKDPLLQKLIDKGTLTKEEAEDIQSRTKLELPKPLQGLSIGGLAYFEYSFGETGHNNTNFNKFALNRGYINIKKDITPWMRARVTPDITQLSSGDMELRMKYYYADFLPPDLGPATGTAVRVGQGHTPWLDFEESINIYRMQGTMFQERAGLFSSSDFGVGVLGNIGGSLTKEQQESVGYATPYSGRYGSYHVGVYNGGGYNKAENNTNKPLEGRLTVRPLPDMIPGLQVSYFGVTGKGNSTDKPDWKVSTGFLSYQNRYLVLTGAYTSAKGDSAGSEIDPRDKKGYSVFGDLRLPVYEKVSVFARHDNFDPDTKVTNNRQMWTMAGAGYRITGANYLVVAYERMHEQKGLAAAGKLNDDNKGQVILQLSF